MTPSPVELGSPDGTGGYTPGQILLEKYELLRPLAVGGMGVVWIAHNRVLDVDVAVKLTLSATLGSSESARQRALSEARLAAQLAHPAVCRVLDFGLTDAEDPFVVTELLRGDTLDSVLSLEGRLSPVEAIQVILPILDGLSAAHEKGIVHRDVKPSNVYLARDAGNRLQPKLLDFGIARGQNETTSWAVSGTVSGTPCYMSPEQARGSDLIDFRTDIWGVCATLFELLSGVPPFEGETCSVVLANVIEAPPVALPLDCGVDEWLGAILMRGLAKEPANRWGSAAELSSELARWLLANGIEADACGHSLRTRLKERGVGLASALYPNAFGQDPTLESPGSGQRRIARPFARRVWRSRAGAAGAVVSVLAVFAFVGFRALETPAHAEGAPQRAALLPLDLDVQSPRADVRNQTSVAARASLAAPPPIVEAALPETAPSDEHPASSRVAPGFGAANSPAPAVAQRRASYLPRRPQLPVAAPVASPPPPARQVPAPAAAVDRPAATPQQAAASAPRKSNALGYDFGF